MGQLKVLLFLGGDGESPGGTPRRLCPGASPRGARCKPGFSGWALDAVGAQTPPCPAVTRRREGLLRLQPLCRGGSAVRGGTHGPFEGGRRALVPAQPGRSLLLTELCVLDTHLQGQPPVLSLGTPCSSPQGNLALAQGALGDRQHGSVCVCIYLQHRVCVGACVGVFSEPPPSVLWPMRLLRSGHHRFMD